MWTVAFLGAAVAAGGGARKPDVRYVPTPPDVVTSMLDAAKVGKDDVVYDLGCGDGRIVIAAVGKYGARKGVGIDIDPERIRQSNEEARKARVADRVTFLEQDLFETDFSEATVVTLYLLPELNLRLRPALLRQLRPGDRIVSHAFDMGEWEADKTIRVGATDDQDAEWEPTAYHWVVPGGAAGTWRWTLPDAGGQRRYELHLRQRFQKVSGTVKIDGLEVPVADAKLDGSQLGFSIVREGEKDKVRMSFSGRIVGNTISGGAENQGGPAAARREWQATRDRAPVAGTWTWTVDDKPVSLHVESHDGRFYGALTTGEAQPRLAQFYVWGAGVYFIADGNPRRTYEGAVDGNRILGTVSTGEGTAKEWTAQRKQ